ncbi:MAG: NADH-quinone oxidoreductase subunit C [Candidatus Hodarchaeales archaeon]|jgi:NADH-quinone oxidoreductase subunit C
MTIASNISTSQEIIEKIDSDHPLVVKFGAAVVSSEWKYLRTLLVEIKLDDFDEVMNIIKEEGISHLSTIIGLESDQGIELLYPFFTNTKDAKIGDKLIVKLILPKKTPEIASLVSRFWGAQFYEQEIYDLLGVNFRGHPNLQRFFLPDRMPEGVHPLRKRWSVEDLQQILADAQKKVEEERRHWR